MIFGFLLTALFVPGLSGAATTPRWALLALAVAAFVPLVRQKLTLAHLLGVAFLAWAALSLAWTAHLADGIDALLKLVILAGLFRIGAATESLDRFFAGAAAGIGVSSVVAIAQTFGWRWIPWNATYPGGLFMNSVSMGEAAALVLIGCAVTQWQVRGKMAVLTVTTMFRHPTPMLALAVVRLWWFIPAVLPALLIARCRGAFAGLAAVILILLWRWSRYAALATGLVGAVVVSQVHGGVASIDVRLEWWRDVLQQLTWLGHGLGSFYTLFPTFGNETFSIRPEHLHNDWLEFAFELGALGSVLLAAILAALVHGPVSLVLVAFIVASCFGFGAHMAVTGCVAALCAGHLSRRCADLRWMFDGGRSVVRAGGEGRQSGKHHWGLARRGAGLAA